MGHAPDWGSQKSGDLGESHVLDWDSENVVDHLPGIVDAVIYGMYEKLGQSERIAI